MATNDEPMSIMDFLKAVKEFSEKEQVAPVYCPFNASRGCLNGEIWTITQEELEDGYRTHECCIKGRFCAAWSSKYGRCLRIEPLFGYERVCE